MGNVDEQRPELSGWDKQLLYAVETCVELEGWRDPDYAITDVVVLVAQSGFPDGNKVSRVLSLSPTDAANYAILGILDLAALQLREEVRLAVQEAAYGDDD